MKTTFRFLSFFLSCLLMSAGPPSGLENKNLMEQICKTRPLLKEAAKQAGLSAILTDEGPYTFFAPSEELLQQLKNTNGAQLRDLLMNQIVAGKINTTDMKDATHLTTLGGAEISVFRKRNQIWINGVQIKERDLKAKNGVMHVVENWLVLPVASQ